MQTPDDRELLREYSRRGSEDAFEAIVRRHVNLVHSAAMRQVRDATLATEVTQTVFLILAKKARSLPEKTILSGWLYRTAQFAGARALRAEMRRRKHEQEAAQMEPESPDPEWEQIEPFLEEAMAGLRDGDRDAVVLRYFENKDLKSVGVALGTNEDTARKRIARAVEKLRAFFHKRGVRLSAVGVAGVLSANAVQAAPPVLASSIAAVAVKGSLTASNLLLLKSTLKIMAWTKLKTTVVVATAVLLTAGTATITVREMQRPGSHGKLAVMPDGSFIRLLNVTAGTNFQYRATPPTALERKLIKYLPSKMASAYNGWMGAGGSMTMNTAGGATNLAVLIARERLIQGGRYTYGSSSQLIVFDDQGDSFLAGLGGGTILYNDGKRSRSIEEWVLDAFPRRSKSIGLRFIQSSPNATTDPVLAEFRVANPLAGDYPVWSPNPIPDTQSDGDLVVTLTSLTAGIVNAPAELGGPNEPATRATFRFEQNGRVPTEWRPASVVISDATGNLWSPYSPVRPAAESGEVFLRGALWPGEPAFKLKLELAKVSDYLPGELCTFKGIKVPAATETNTDNFSAEVLGSQLRMVAFTGASAEQPGNLKWYLQNGKPRISVRVTPMPDDGRMSLLKVTDDRGRDVPIESAPDYGMYHSSEKVFALTLAPDAATVDCTFALSKSRFVEFVVKPEIVTANK